MKHHPRRLLIPALLALSAFGFNESPIAPQTESVEPRIGKPGTVIKVKGKALDRAHVDEVFLTDHRFDMKVKILEQTATSLVIRVPPFVKAGRLQLLILTAGANPVYLEQPWFVQIETDDETPSTPAPVTISQAPKPKATVEIASTGSTIPVPVGGNPPPSPATSSGLEKSVVPLRAPEPVPAPVEPKPAPVETKPIVESRPVIVDPKPDPPPAESKTAPEPETRPIVTQAPVQQPIVTQAPAQQPIVSSSQAPPAAPPTGAAPPPQAPAVDNGNIPAQLVQRARVVYPPGAQAQRIDGIVELVAVIGADGKVKSTKVLKGNPFLAAAAIASVREWLYEPAYLHGKPVSSEVNVVLNFKRP